MGKKILEKSGFLAVFGSIAKDAAARRGRGCVCRGRTWIMFAILILKVFSIFILKSLRLF